MHLIVAILLPSGQHFSGVESHPRISLQQLFRYDSPTCKIRFLFLVVVSIFAILRFKLLNQRVEIIVFFLVIKFVVVS